MYISKKRHDLIVKGMEEIESTLRVELRKERNRAYDLEKELKQAKDLRMILEKLADKVNYAPITSSGWTVTGGSMTTDLNVHLPGYAKVIADHVTGDRVLEHEATTPAITISKDGKVSQGKTIEAPDKGYSYKLVRG